MYLKLNMDSKHIVLRSSSYNKEKEHTESVKLLYKFFSNNLLLCQWESARACVEQLRKEGSVIRLDIDGILENVATYPFCKSVGSSTVVSPAHLSWLCLLECHRLQHENITEGRHVAFAEIDFRLLLYEACGQSDAAIIKELYRNFIHKHSELHHKSSEHLLSKSALAFLKQTLDANPTLGHAVITSLIQYDCESKDNENLQSLYLQCLSAILDNLSKAASDSVKSSEFCDKVYLLLGMCDPLPYWNYIQLRQLFSHLTELLRSNKADLSKDKILSVLVGRRSSYLIEEFSSLEFDLSVGKVETQKGAVGQGEAGGLSHDQQLLLLSENQDGNICWRKMLQMAVRQKKHVLEMILDTSLCLIRLERFPELHALLLPVELHPLKAVILLLGWSHCKTSTVARKLLDVLWDKNAASCHPALTAGCRKLAYQIDLIHWCIDKARPLLESASASPVNEQATHLLHGLETHSVLFVLHQSTSLASLEPREVLDLLQNSVTKQTDGCEKKRKNVRFVIDGREQEVGGPTKLCNKNQPISIEQERDIAIYRGFCCMKNVMDILKFCFEYSDVRLMNPFCGRRLLRSHRLSKLFSSELSMSSSEGEESGSTTNTVFQDNAGSVSDYSSFDKLYQEHVTAKLRDTKDHLTKLHPLTFRVEVMENIFSLLFVMHEDLQESSMINEFDSGEEGAQTESKRSSQDMISEEEVSPQICDNNFFTTNSDSQSKDQNVSVGANYDEPFVEKPVVFQPVVKTISASHDQVFDDSNKHGQNASNMNHNFVKQLRSRKISVGATGEKGLVSKFGFLVNEYIVRDILAMLKDSLVDLGAVRYQLMGAQKSEVLQKTDNKTMDDGTPNVDAAVEHSLTQLVKSSISEDALQPRLTRLTQYVHEAQWRFQLVSHDQLPRQSGVVLQQPIFVSNDDISNACLLDGYHSNKKKGSFSDKSSVSQTGKSCPATEKHSACLDDGSSLRWSRQTASRSESHGLAPSGHDAGIVSLMQSSPHDGSSPRRSHQTASRSESHGLAPSGHDAGIVSLMLSSPHTLLVMSLTKGNHAQASQVIKLFKLQSQVETLEVGFSEAFRKAAVKLHSLETGGSGVPSKQSQPGQLSIRSLGSVAAVGVASASLGNVTDDLLSLVDIPQPAVPKGLASAPDHIRRVFKDANSTSALLMDLVCTSCQTWDLCCKLFDVMKTKSDLSSSSGGGSGSGQGRENALSSYSDRRSRSEDKRSRSEVRLKGFREFKQQMENLIYSSADEDGGFKASSDEIRMSSSIPKHSLEYQLTKATCPLNLEENVSFYQTWKDMKECIEKVQTAFAHVSRIIKDESVLPTSSASPQKTSALPSPKSSTHNQRLSKMTQKKGPPVLHTSFKQFISTIETQVPHGGIIYLLKKQTSDKHNDKNYLQSLYDHVKVLAFLVAECESKSKETMIVPQNYFKILQEGPVAILGRLMFVKKMIPARLEAVAENLSLKLTHIIVHSCCPRIPSKHLPLGTSHREYDQFGTKTVYNSGPCSTASGNNMEVIVQTILTRLLKFMQDVAAKSNAKGIFDITCATLAVELPEYREIISFTKELQTADLTLLKSREATLCFLANLQNVMTIHQHLHLVWLKQHSQMCAEADSNKLAMSRDVGELRPVSTIGHIVQLKQFAYRVGQLGVVSLFDLKFVLNHHGLLPPARWKEILHQSILSVDERDCWSQFCSYCEPKLLFVLADGSMSSPALQVLTPELLDVQLTKATKDFLQHTVEVNLEAKRVRIPAIVHWYREDFSQETENKIQIKLEGLLNFVAEQLPVDRATHLYQLLDFEEAPENLDMSGGRELPFTVKIDTHSSEFGFVFETSMIPTGLHTHRRISSLPKNFECSTDSFLQSCESGFVVEKPAYQLTPVTLDYVKNDSSLVATLVSLVCADELDDIDQQLEDDHFLSESEKSRSISLSDISLVDIRSYRYQRLTEDFPILQRHLLNYIVPLAAVDKPELLAGDEPILKFVTNEIDDTVKVCMLSLHDSIQFQDVITTTIKHACTSNNWLAILRLFNCIPEVTMSNNTDWQIIHDLVLACWADGESRSNPDSAALPAGLKAFYCRDTQARTALAVCDRIPEHHGIDVIEACLIHSLSGNLKETLEVKLKYLRIYSQITDSVKTLQFRLSTNMSEFINTEEMNLVRSYTSNLERFTDWRVIVRVTRSSPKEVLEVLIKTGDFEIAKTWANLHSLPEEIELEIDEQYILTLLQSKTSHTTKAFQVLENLKAHSSTLCLAMCESLLAKLTDFSDTLFIASYILNSFKTELSEELTETHRLRLIGAKALLCLPRAIRGEYSYLITCPHLILEQLLMNMKVDLAGQVFHKIKRDFTQIQTPPLSYTTEQFNELLIEYATKAVEVTVVQVIETEKERSQSSCSGCSVKMDDTDFPVSTARFLGDSVRGRKKAIDGTVSPTVMAGSPLGSSPGLNKKITSLSSKLASSPNRFVMPTQPPPKHKWVPDSATAVCMVCKVERFSMFNRRHHCRRCGRVACAACSAKRSTVGGATSRTCDDCYAQIYLPTDMKSREREFYSHRRKESLTGVSPSVLGHSPAGVGSPDDHIDHQGVEIPQNDSMWQLTSDVNHNTTLREEFYYEQAPSVSLCMSILHLHSDQQQCGQQMLKMCDYLSEFLQPVSPGLPNPEVDYALIISMMLQLLFQAKLKFLKCGDNQGLGVCDMYQIRVDLLKILVAANYRDLPSIQQLTKVDTVRRLRDKLIENERLSLAMEVSTKCGIDPAGVWAAWGMACFHCGDYTGAREKFSHCLRVPKDRNHSSTSSHLLSEIIDYLEHMPSSGMTEIQMFQSNQGSLKSIVNFPTVKNSEEISIDTTPFQECLFYLRSYGTFREHLDFLRRNGYWMKAAKYILDHKCSTDVFIDSLVEPALLCGELSKLLDQMLMLDTSLDRWSVYLTTTCRHLLKQRLFNSLYHVQLFMKDFIRAAMICISHFYQHRAQSYRDLAGRIHFLFTAQQHMQAYLDPSKWGSVRHPTSSPLVKKGPDWSTVGTPESTVRMVLSPEEVTKYMNSIALQIEITNFLDQCLANMEGEATALAASCTAESQTSDLPSLFGNAKIKSDLVCMILLSGNDITVSFDLSNRIIKECRLSAASILNHTAREMAKRQRYGLVKQLLDCVAATSAASDDMNDEVIGSALLAIVDKDSEVKEAENLIKLLKKESNKINAFILCGKLRSAYLLAVRGERVEDVQRIAGAAQRAGQTAVRNICTKWLQQRKQ